MAARRPLRGPAPRLEPACCPICGHALRLVLTRDGPRWCCPLCGVVRPPA